MINAATSLEKPPRMLIADDDPLIVQLLADRCRRVGFDVELSHGLQALIKANRVHPDVMVIDVNMPEADGLTVCARLLDPSRRPLNVVVVTGSRGPKPAERCEGFGAIYICKRPEVLERVGSCAERALSAANGQYGRTSGNRRSAPKCATSPCWRSTMTFRPSNSSPPDSPNAALSCFSVGYRTRIPDSAQGNAERRNIRLFSAERRGSLSSGEVTYNTGNREIPVFVLTGRDLGEVTEQSLMREVCGKPGVAQIFRKSPDTDDFFGALQKLCGFENNRADR